jgi:Cu-Zn family superoxide dismutase
MSPVGSQEDAMRRAALTHHLPVAVGACAAGLFAASPALAGSDHVRADGALTVYSAEVPAGATARVEAVYDSAGDSVVTLVVRGLAPRTEYGAHAHVGGCGPDGAAAGPNFQNVVDPVSPSVDPAYANRANEIWLDLTTDAAGSGVAHATVSWQFPPERRPRSVILHERHTSKLSGSAGTAGARLACLGVRF